MDTILFLAHTEADGTLAKPALEALGSAVDLKQALGGDTRCRTVRRRSATRGQLPRELRSAEISCR